MGYLYNATPNVTESNKLLLSTWIRVPVSAVGPYAGICEWALESTTHLTNKSNWIALVTYDSGSTWHFSGSITGKGRERNPPGDLVNVADNIGITVSAPDTLISRGLWYHILMAIDAGENLNNYGTDGATVGTVVINGVTKDPFSVVANTGPLSNIYNYATENTGVGLRMLGKPVGVPWVFVGDIPSGRGDKSVSVVEKADFQLWYGLYIDPTIEANFSKFVNIIGVNGYPVNPSVAAAAFGTQTILFKGKASDASFYFNRGNGGSFSKIGTAVDFVPGPGF